MAATWKKHCPYDVDEKPARWRAWREGWMYRKEHGPVTPPKETERKMTEQLLFSSWLQGYTAAEEHLQEAEGDR